MTSSRTALAVAACLLGLALEVNWGTWHPAAFALLVAAIVAACAGLATRRDGSERTLLLVLIGATVLQLVVLALGPPPGMLMDFTGVKPRWPLWLGTASAATLTLAGLSTHRLAGWPRFALLCLIHLALGRWLIWASPDPVMDVHVFEKLAVTEFLHGGNPWAMTFPDTLGDPSLYGPGLVVDGRVQFGFPYPPVVLLFLTVGRVLGTDPRYPLLLAFTAAAVLMAAARPSRVGFAAASLFLFTPRALFVVEQSWTEPLMVLLLAGTVFAATRFPRSLPAWLGLLVVSKQYFVFALPALGLLRATRRQLLIAAAVGVAFTVPFLLWNPSAFLDSVLWLQMMQPFRPDALSALVPLGLTSSLWGFAAAALAAIVAALRLPRTPSGFAAALGVTLLFFFAFNKQAFCNYYFFVIGAFATAIASGSATSGTPRPAAPAADSPSAPAARR